MKPIKFSAGARALRASLCFAPLLLACGGRSIEISDRNNTAASGSSSAGSATANGGAAAGDSTGGSANTNPNGGAPNAKGGTSSTGGYPPAAGAAGSGGGPFTEPSVANFAGRWALVMSEELSGVQLVQMQGVLGGTGCGGGVPPSTPCICTS